MTGAGAAAPALSGPAAALCYPLLDLQPAADGGFSAQVPEPLCVGRPGATFLFGGCAFAAGIAALERTTGAPAILASAQFAMMAREGDCIAFAPAVAAAGKAIRQATLAAQIGGAPFAFLHGAFGRRDDPTAYQGGAMPAVAPRAACPERSVARLLSSNVNRMFEVRLAAGALPDRPDWSGAGGQDLACWVALRSGAPITRLTLPVIADIAAIALPAALGHPASGTSLDNSIRFVADPDDDAVLAAIRVDAVRDGIAHITTRIFAPAGQLLAIAQQSMILRVRPPD